MDKIKSRSMKLELLQFVTLVLFLTASEAKSIHHHHQDKTNTKDISVYGGDQPNGNSGLQYLKESPKENINSFVTGTSEFQSTAGNGVKLNNSADNDHKVNKLDRSRIAHYENVNADNFTSSQHSRKLNFVNKFHDNHVNKKPDHSITRINITKDTKNDKIEKHTSTLLKHGNSNAATHRPALRPVPRYPYHSTGDLGHGIDRYGGINDHTQNGHTHGGYSGSGRFNPNESPHNTWNLPSSASGSRNWREPANRYDSNRRRPITGSHDNRRPVSNGYHGIHKTIKPNTVIIEDMEDSHQFQSTTFLPETTETTTKSYVVSTTTLDEFTTQKLGIEAENPNMHLPEEKAPAHDPYPYSHDLDHPGSDIHDLHSSVSNPDHSEIHNSGTSTPNYDEELPFLTPEPGKNFNDLEHKSSLFPDVRPHLRIQPDEDRNFRYFLRNLNETNGNDGPLLSYVTESAVTENPVNGTTAVDGQEEEMFQTPIGPLNKQDMKTMVGLLLLVSIVLLIGIVIVLVYCVKAKLKVKRLDMEMRRACLQGLEHRYANQE